MPYSHSFDHPNRTRYLFLMLRIVSLAASVIPTEKSIFDCLSSVHPMSCELHDIACTEDKQKICYFLWPEASAVKHAHYLKDAPSSSNSGISRVYDT